MEGTISVRRVDTDEEIVELPSSVGVLGQAFSADRRFLAVNYAWNPGPGRGVALWRLSPRGKVFELTEQMMTHRAMTFSPDSRLLAVGRGDGSICLHSTEDGKLMKRIEIKGAAYMIQFDPQGKRIAVTGFPDGRVEIWDVATGELSATIPLAEKGRFPSPEVAWHPFEDTLAVCSGSYLSFWNATEGKLLRMVDAHPRQITDHLAFSDRGDLLVTTTWEAEMALWNPLSGTKLLSVPRIMQHGWGQRFQFGANDTLMAYDLVPPNIRLWKVAHARECLQLPGTGGQSVAFHPQDRIIAVTDSQGIRFWDRASPRSLAFIPNPNEDGALVRFHPRGDALVVANKAGLDRWPIREDRSSGKLRIEVGPPEKLKSGFPRNLILSADGSELFVTDRQGQCISIEWSDITRQEKFGPHPNMTCATGGSDRKWIATGTWRGKGIKIWNRKKDGDTTQPSEIIDLASKNTAASLAVSPTSRWLVTGDESGFKIWDSSTWQLVTNLDRPGYQVPGLIEFSPDERMVALGFGEVIKLFSTSSWTELATLTPPEQKLMGEMCFSSDSSQLAVSVAGVLQIWDLRAIRTQLAEMNLDWDLPSYESARSEDRTPIEMKIVATN